MPPVPWKPYYNPIPLYPNPMMTTGPQKITVSFFNGDVAKGQALLKALEASGQQIDKVEMRQGYYNNAEMTITFWAKMFAEVGG